MTLALLITAVTGAWADETPIVTITATGSGPAYSVEGIVTLETGGASYTDVNGWNSGSPINLTVTAADGVTITKVKFFGNKGSSWEDTESPFQVLLQNYYVKNTFGINIGPDDGVKSIEVYGTIAPAEPGIDVTPGETVNQWTFTMPGSDVVLTPIYAKAAAFATTGTEPEVKTLLPEAAEGVIAGTDASLIAEGTGIVAFAGESTDATQGTLMYAIGTSATEAPDLDDFNATVPTAKNVADDGADVYVWYYIKGANTPDGEEATAENTFNDSEICETPIKVTVLPNKYDIQFNAANDNTIEAGKATVTVGGTDKTVTEGKLEGVKMGSEVKVKAKEGYKFRKVEVKKGAAGKTITIGDMELTYADGDTWETIVSKNSDKIKTIAGGYIVQVAQPASNQYRYIKVVLSNKVNPSDIIDPSKNYEWGTIEVYS